MLLAKGPGAPDGDLLDSLVVRLALNPQGQIDPDAYDVDPAPWLATRARPGAETRHSELIRLDEGWALQSLASEDDPLWTLEGHVFRPGDLVRLGRPDGEELLFRIVASEPG
ncbi:MAG: hypothetical protein H7Z10_07185 [Gemmatimonadaceae bacterium]|nr:hypothetical protein [Acetobacteraceae bacterium]